MGRGSPTALEPSSLGVPALGTETGSRGKPGTLIAALQSSLGLRKWAPSFVSFSAGVGEGRRPESEVPRRS